MNINTAIRNATLTHLLPEIAQSATTQLSFFGKKSIRVPGYEGVAAIDSLPAKVIELVRAKHFTYTPEERTMGKSIGRNIDRVYRDSDKQVANSNCLTRLICAVREFFYNFSLASFLSNADASIRGYWKRSGLYDTFEEKGYREVFKYYTPQQFLERYGREPEAEKIVLRFGLPKQNFPHVRLALELREEY